MPLNEFVIRDSGKRRVFETGAQRDAQEGKGRYDLLPVLALRAIALIFEGGAKKYAPRNWEKGIPLSRYIDSGLRHAFKAIEGWDDEDHWGQAAWNFLCGRHTLEMIQRGLLPQSLNDLPNYMPADAQQCQKIMNLITPKITKRKVNRAKHTRRSRRA